MTGFGTGKSTKDGITAMVELRSVNNRFIELNSKLPKSLAARENDIKEILRKELNRGKINIFLQIEKNNNEEIAIQVDENAVKNYMGLLQTVKKTSGLTDEIKLDHLLKFGELFKSRDLDDSSELEWAVCKDAIDQAIVQLKDMRKNEGITLVKDLDYRIHLMTDYVTKLKVMSDAKVPEERQKLKDKVAELLGDSKVNPDRLELEIVLLADKLDITEEIVRFNSHVEYFLKALKGEESVGRKLNFLVQEMNREVNTMGSKSNSAEIAHLVVSLKEELERIREQLQNIE